MKSIYTIILLFVFGQSIGQIISAEYFIDVDPGVGNGGVIPVTSDYTLSANMDIDVDDLALGFHTMYVRVKDVEGSWSLYDKQTFHKMTPINDSEITYAEYFIDTDPGTGNGSSIPITEGFILDEEFEIETTGLSTGFHNLYVRVKDGDEVWASYDKQLFRIQDAGPIVTAEYFVGADPGQGNGTEISIQSGFNISENVDLSTLDLDAGVHLLSIRVKDSDNVWSQIEQAEFTIVSIDNISEESSASFVIFPNPTAEMINIKSDWKIEGLSVYDMGGKLVKNYNSANTRIDVGNLPKGTYLLIVQSSSGTEQFTFIKN